MSTALIARDASGNVLYDTSKSIYGLIKSGPVEYHGAWRRTQPSGGPHIYFDSIYKFTVAKAISPIVFVTGACNQPVASKEGDNYVFYFAGPVSNIKVYCFDIMAPIFSGPALKTRSEDGKFTFNSLQRPLNVIGTSISTPPTGPWSETVPVAAFQGGTTYIVVSQLNNQDYTGGFRGYFWTRALDPQKTYAAHIPWSRGCWSTSQLNSDIIYRGSLHEGCYGQTGSIVHCFWTSPETTYGSVHSTTRVGITALTVDPRPACSYIDVSEYPYPFNPQL